MILIDFDAILMKEIHQNQDVIEFMNPGLSLYLQMMCLLFADFSVHKIFFLHYLPNF